MRTKFVGIKSGFTLIELMIVVLMISILAATAMAFWKDYAIRAKTGEAVYGVSKIVTGETEYYSKNLTFISAGPTNFPPAAIKQSADFRTDPNWSHLSFGFVDPIYYGYQATVVSTNSVECEAQGDLNGNGITSVFRQTVSYSTEGIAVSQLLIFDELE